MTKQNGIYVPHQGKIHFDIDEILRQEDTSPPIKHPAKPLEIIVAYRETNRLVSPRSFFPPLDAHNIPEITAAHRALASEISAYYQTKIIMRKLLQQGPDHSNKTFSRDLVKALMLNDQYQSLESQHGILYRIYDFYLEDRALEELAELHQSHSGAPNFLLGCDCIYNDLSFVKKIYHARRLSKHLVYYFQDQERQLVRISVNASHAVAPVMSVLEQAKKFTIIGDLFNKRLSFDYKDFQVMEALNDRWQIESLEV